MASGWVITEEAARQRDLAALGAFREVVRREITPDMPDDAVMMRLARHGYTGAEIKRLDQIADRLVRQIGATS